MRYAEDDETAPWLEEDLQMAVVRELKRYGVIFAADQAGSGKRSKRQGARLKLAGMVAGEPDLRLYMPGGKLVMIEMKCKASVSKEQRERHAALRALGYDVRVVKAKTPAHAIAQVVDIIAIHGYRSYVAPIENHRRAQEAAMLR